MISETWRDKVDAVATRVDALTLRERILLLITVLVVLYFVWYTFVSSYMLASDQEIEASIKRINDQISSLQGQVDVLSQVIGRDPTAVLIARAKDLKQQNSDLLDKITGQTRKMASPKDMVQIIKKLIEQTQGLTLTSLSNVESQPLFPSKNRQNSIQVYSHGIVMEMSGDYFDTVRFLELAEQQPYKLLWDTLSYEVAEYPKAKIKISLRTLGLQEGWIGV